MGIAAEGQTVSRYNRRVFCPKKILIFLGFCFPEAGTHVFPLFFLFFFSRKKRKRKKTICDFPKFPHVWEISAFFPLFPLFRVFFQETEENKGKSFSVTSEAVLFRKYRYCFLFFPFFLRIEENKGKCFSIISVRSLQHRNTDLVIPTTNGTHEDMTRVCAHKLTMTAAVPQLSLQQHILGGI